LSRGDGVLGSVFSGTAGSVNLIGGVCLAGVLSVLPATGKQPANNTVSPNRRHPINVKARNFFMLISFLIAVSLNGGDHSSRR